MKLILSLSISGSIIILTIIGIRFLGKRFFKKQWLYYLWLLALLRLVLPFAPELSLVNVVVDNFSLSSTIAVGDNVSGLNQDSVVIGNGGVVIGSERVQDAGFGEPVDAFFKSALEVVRFIWEYFWVVWLVIALICLAYRLTTYYNFARYVRAGSHPVDNPELMDLLAEVCELLKVKRPLELSVNPLIASPLLLGIRKPEIVIPDEHLDAAEMKYIFMHEVVHYKRKDIFYIWGTQLVTCIHWFNPLVYLLNSFVQWDRELACDEVVISHLSDAERFEYGDTLLNSLAVSGTYKEREASLSLHENAKALKERLQVIANSRMPGKAAKAGFFAAVTVVSVLGIGLGAYHIDVSGFRFTVAPNIIDVSSGNSSSETKALELEPFHAIDINGETEVTIKNGSQESVILSKGSDSEIAVVDGVLTYTPNPDDINQITITLQTGKQYNQINIVGDYQDVKLDTITADTIYITTNTGTLYVDNVEAKVFESDTAGYDQHINNSHFGEATITTTATDAAIDNVTVDNKLVINNTFGLAINGLTAATADFNAISVGEVALTGAVLGDINIHTTNLGKIILHLDVSPDYYTITTNETNAFETLLVNGTTQNYPYYSEGSSSYTIAIDDQNAVGTNVELYFN